MLIGELSGRTGVPARLLRYYEEQDLLHPERDSNGYRCYDAADVDRVEQIRGLLDSGLTTEIIRRILPFLACGIHLPAQCLTAETAELLEREAERLGQRIDCLSRNRDAILAYLTAVPPGPGVLDAVWEEARIIVEIDGIHHMDAAQWWDDMDRENGIKLDGYLVLRFTAFVVRYRPGYVAAQIRDAFRTAGHPGVTSSCQR